MTARRLCIGLAGLAAALAGAAQPASAREGAKARSVILASALADVETTGALPPVPSDRMKADDALDLAVLKAAVTAFRRGALSDGQALARTIGNPAARTLLQWIAMRCGANVFSFAQIEAFLAAHPDYPGVAAFRRQAEAALIAERKAPDTVLRFFGERAPLSPAGRVALAIAQQATGKTTEASELIRRVWRMDHLGQPLEQRVIEQFSAVLGEADHRLRAERYLFRGNADAGLRNAARVSADYVVLAKARLAGGRAKRPIPAAIIAGVPASQRGEISFLFLEIQQARRENKIADAAKALATVTRDPSLLGDGDEWWTERRLIARKLLDAGDAATAYTVAAGHGAEDAAERIEAEWHAGFIALRFKSDPDAALTHFQKAAAAAETPISVARSAYWQGRALEAMGQSDEAQAAYEQAARHPIAYYGQLARAKLGESGLPLRQHEPSAIDHLPGAAGLTLLYAIGARDLAATMLGDLALQMNDTAALASLAEVAEREGDLRSLMSLGKASLQRGFPLDAAAFPTSGIPDFPVLGDPMERAVVHAIARQESAFDPTAMSPAGARGLMQMMPATARETARRARLPFDWEKLGRDPLYAAQMGAAHLNDLLKEWRGSYILTFAAYNAGSGNVRAWIEAYGDPRKAEIDAVDWVERIPFSETRNYIQRVMENLQVYRQRLNQRTAYLIDQDLKRGGLRN